MITISWIGAVVLLLAISFLWTVIRGAPWLPTDFKVVRKMLDMADVGPNDVLYDLGCGDGRILVTTARRYGARAVGIEIDPLRFLWCQLLITILGLRSQVTIIFGDFFAQDLSTADVVTCYLLPSTNKKLERKLLQELAPQTRVISNDFVFPNLQLVRQDIETDIYMYHPIPHSP